MGVLPSGELRAGAIEALCERLRGSDVPLSLAIVTAARRHQVHLLLAGSMTAAECEDPRWADLGAELRGAAVVDAVRERVLRRLIQAFAAAGLDVLLLKGAGLGHTVYASPHLRPRGDTDLMIARASLTRAERLLASEGWARIVEPDAELAASQRHYTRRVPPGITELLDLHWKVAMPQVFADTVTFDELLSRAETVPALGPHARTLSMPDALVLACLHRVAHHGDAVDLLWLWDVHLVASRLSEEARGRFVALATRQSMRAVCARGLELAGECFHTKGARDLIARLRAAATTPEPSERFLRGGLRQVDVLRLDLESLGAWRSQVALLREHLFPPSAYMRARYPRLPAALVPIAYLHRIVQGAPKWFRRQSL